MKRVPKRAIRFSPRAFAASHVTATMLISGNRRLPLQIVEHNVGRVRREQAKIGSGPLQPMELREDVIDD